MQNSILKSSKQVRVFYILTDLIIIAACFYLSYIFKYNTLENIFTNANLQNLREYTFVFLLWFIFILIFFRRSNLYSTNRGLSIPREIITVCLNVTYGSILAGAVIFFMQYKFFSRQVFLENFIMLCLLLSIWRSLKRVILRNLIRRGFHNINFLIVGAAESANNILEEINQNPWLGFKVVGFLDDGMGEPTKEMPVLGKIDEFSAVAKKYFVDEVIVSMSSGRRTISKLIQEAKDLRLGLSVVAEDFDEPLPVLSLSYLGIIPLINYRERTHHPAEIILKTVFDICVSLVLVILLSPLFAVIAILIKLDSAGDIFYVQKRVGAKGRIFDFYKFRSMIKDADELKPSLLDRNEAKGGIIFKIKDDPRITRIGRFLRKSSLDELPQLFNVIKTDMSLVGPRPPTPDEVEKYHYDYMQRLSIKPGITGLSQIKGRSELSFRRWVRWDIWYINNWSFALDLKILWLTLPAVLKKKGAY